MSQQDTLTSLLAGNDTLPSLRVTGDDGISYTRSQLNNEINNVAKQLSKMGIKRGDVVSLSFANDVELIVSFLATCSLGATSAPLNPGYNTEEVEFYLNDLSSNLLLVPGKGNKSAEAAARNCKVGVATAVLNLNGSVTITPKEGCSIKDGHTELTKPEADDVALFLHTSGTTGKPKGVPLSHKNMLVTMKNIVATYELTVNDIGYVVMPLFHVHGLMAALFGALYSGGSIVLPANGAGFQANMLWKDIAKYKCTWFTAVPTMHQSLLASPQHYDEAGKPQLRFIRSCSSSLPPPVLYKLESTFQAPVLEAYAMTEACHQMTSNPLPSSGPHKPGSVGKAFNVELKILDSQDNELPPHTVGEVCVKAANITKG